MSSTTSKPDQADVSLAGRRARVGDVVEINIGLGLYMAEIDQVGPSELLAKDQLSVYELHGEASGPDHIITRDQVRRLWREVTR